MSKILFTHSYFYKYDLKQLRTGEPYPPLGTLYAASFLRHAGYSVALFDTNLADSPASIKPVIDKETPEYVVIYDDGFNYLTKMCLTNMRHAAFRLTKIAKGYNTKVIVSGSDSADHYEEYLDNGADFVIIGEGEVTLKELIVNLETEGNNFNLINGLAYREKGVTRKTPKREILHDLDSFPFPAWDLVEIEKYKDIWMKNHGYFSLNITTTRGCPYKCNWCAKPIYGNRYNTRSPRNVVDELEYLIHKTGATYFWFCDDIFGLKPGWIIEFSKLIKQRNLNFHYKIQSRVDIVNNSDTIDALQASGADTIWVGAESGSQKILDAMDKGTTINQIYTATNLLKERKIKVAFFIQIGYLGETKEDLEKTIKMIKELLPDDIGISVSYPLPGTKFYEIVKDDLRAKKNWTDSNDLAMMFRSTFPPEYYRIMHHYIHRVYRYSKAIKVVQLFLSDPFNQYKSFLMNTISAFYYLPQIFLDSLKLRITEHLI
jgi:anaerobic magnesium-protoporphyrin IX monomethyl ester cyclase